VTEKQAPENNSWAFQCV